MYRNSLLHNLSYVYTIYYKRCIDFFVSLCLILVLFPLILITGILLFIFNNGNVLFIQERIGKKDKIFTLIKFKTMNNDKDIFGNLKSDNERLTKSGKILRSTSIDELPQLFNVLKGEMSLVGPRPLLIKYLPLYNEEQRKRHNVCPGITGWAQIHGRNTINWAQKFEFDVWYVNNLSFLLDIKIIWFTIIKVFRREGINSEGNATIAPFNGNN